MIYVTADLHGIHPKEMQNLLASAKFSGDDFLFILGDVIDRGTYGAELLSWLTQQPNMSLILGNHEAMLLSCAFLFADVNEQNLDALTVNSMELVQNWIDNGGKPTMAGFQKLLKQDPELVTGILEYLQDCPLYEEVEAGGKNMCWCTPVWEKAFLPKYRWKVTLQKIFCSPVHAKIPSIIPIRR